MIMVHADVPMQLPRYADVNARGTEPNIRAPVRPREYVQFPGKQHAQLGLEPNHRPLRFLVLTDPSFPA